MLGAQGSTSRYSVRPPAVAGLFYPAEAQACRQLAAAYVQPRPQTARLVAARAWIGGIVPHAGWICSAAVAGQTIAAMAPPGKQVVDVVVVFGAVHTPANLQAAALDTHRSWLVPGGDSPLPQELEAKLVESSSMLFDFQEEFHRNEHAVEVELPLIQQAWPKASVLPIEVPLIDAAIEIGQRTARQIAAANLNAVFLASSDLTHYGPNYGFAPAGVGENGIRWAMDNDRRLLDAVARFDVESIVPEVRGRLNACGGGAIAAMMAASREFGASTGQVIWQTNSYQTLADVAPQPPTNAVGYAAVVVG